MNPDLDDFCDGHDGPDFPLDLRVRAGGQATLPGFDAQAQWPLLYAELRRIAARLMTAERSGHTLSPTALVHEAWLKLGAAECGVNDHGHFLCLAARAMRRILANHALARQAGKRQGVALQVSLSLADAEPAAQSGPEEVLALDQALAQPSSEDARAAQVAELKRSSVACGLGPEAVAVGLGEGGARRLMRAGGIVPPAAGFQAHGLMAFFVRAARPLIIRWSAMGLASCSSPMSVGIKPR